MTITAVYRNGVLQPKEPLELAEGCELEVEITQKGSSATEAPFSGGRKWGLGYVTYVAPDFDETPPGFEDYM